MTQKEGVDSVHTLGFGFGCTGVGLGRMGRTLGEWRFFWGSGWFESHRGHAFSLFRGLLASECGHFVHLWAPSGAYETDAGKSCPCLAGQGASPTKPGSSLRGCYVTGDEVSGVLQCCGIGCNDDVGKISSVVSEVRVDRADDGVYRFSGTAGKDL